MKKANILIISMIAALIVGVVLISGMLLINHGIFFDAKDSSEIAMNRYIAICTNPQMDGWQDVKQGLEKAAEKNQAAIEFLEKGFEESRADASCVEMAVDSGADGIILYANDGALDEELDYAAENSVPVVMVINSYNHDQIFQLGSDPMLLAEKMLEYIDEMDVENNSIAIISSNQSEEYKSGQFMMKFEKTGRNVTLHTFAGPHVFDANQTVKELIASEEEIDMICCLDATATLGVAQSIVELNKVNVISIVGCGKTDEILKMIQKGVVSATVAVDYEKIGTEAIGILMANSRKPFLYDQRIISDVYVIDPSNVRSFLMEEGAE